VLRPAILLFISFMISLPSAAAQFLSPDNQGQMRALWPHIFRFYFDGTAGFFGWLWYN
jgi:hypothetical protein